MFIFLFFWRLYNVKLIFLIYFAPVRKMTDRLLQPMERKLKDYAVLALKGMGMGAADVVPGVSGEPLRLLSAFTMNWLIQ